MTLTQLEYIVAVDTYRGFVLAAEKCFVTQPTLSMQIQKLEDELDLVIFDRSRQPVVPTEAGAEVIAQARRVLRESYRLSELVSDRKGQISGELKIGIIPTLAPYLMPAVISAFLDNYPDVTLHVWEFTTDQIVSGLKSSQLDCGILATPVRDNSLNEMPLFYESFVAYLSKSSNLLSKKVLSAEDVQLDNIWLLNEGHCMRNQILNICDRRKASLTNAFEYNTDSVETLKRMVDMNRGLTFLPELSTSGLSAKEMDRVRYFKSPEPTREISLVTHRSYLKGRLISALQEEILKTVPKRMTSKVKKNLIGIYT